MPAHRRINAAGQRLIESFEGRRHTVYLDPVGLPTVGIGHLLSAAEKARWPVGTRITEAEIDALFAGDIARFERAVMQSVTIPITENQFAALVSLAFNIGAGAFRQSTLLKELNRGNSAAAAGQFERWNKAGGRVLPGLVRRRAAERSLFETADAPAEAIMVTALPLASPQSMLLNDRHIAAPTSGEGWSDWFPRLELRYFSPLEILPVKMGAKNGILNTAPAGELWVKIAPTVWIVDELRHQLRAPITVTSGYRNPAYNSAIGGAPESQHVKFTALDIKSSRKTPAQLFDALRDLRSQGLFKGGVGKYATHVHVDTRGTNHSW